MPLALPAGGVVTPDPPPPSVERLECTWTAPDGTEVPLTTQALGWWTLADAEGLGAAPVEHTVDAHPRGGVRVRHTQPQQRYIVWPLRFVASTHTTLIANWRYVARQLTATRRQGPGTLRIQRPDGSARQIEAYYQGGFDSEPRGGWLFDSAVVTLLCEDPYWSDTEAETFSAEYVAATTPFLDPLKTITAPSLLSGEVTIYNPGEVEAWPSWVITGPMTAIVATNSTTGEEFTLTHTLVDSTETITITTDPPRVRGPADEVLTSALTWPGAVLWGLDPGSNSVTFAVSGPGAGTQVDLTWTPRYETA